jgi:hypothetical protein
MTPEELDALAQEIWGPVYRSKMGRELGVGLQCVDHYRKGRRAIPPGVANHLKRLRELQLAQADAALA